MPQTGKLQFMCSTKCLGMAMQQRSKLLWQSNSIWFSKFDAILPLGQTLSSNAYICMHHRQFLTDRLKLPHGAKFSINSQKIKRRVAVCCIWFVPALSHLPTTSNRNYSAEFWYRKTKIWFMCTADLMMFHFQVWVDYFPSFVDLSSSSSLFSFDLAKIT